MENKNDNAHDGLVNQPEKIETDSLLNHSRQELIELARNLLNGKYQRNSQQREKIMHLLVEQLSSAEAAK
ncbi:MAG TPA: hypothetical protein VJ915_01305 [Balneolaceae bacterium]|nr:hypothetical protein [Balneolaceae bacterium]